GVMMLRWQRLSRGLTAEDGPRVEVVEVDELPDVLPHHTPISPAEYAERISARQVGVARRMIS
ncbi:MAG TPA: hypothetical protein VGD51_04065, partial [Nocardioidaceae bacterium]